MKDMSLIRSLHKVPMPTKRRKCLKCQNMFPSVGPGNRICTPCTSENSHEAKHATPHACSPLYQGISNGVKGSN